MAGSLIKIDEEIVSSATASFTLGGSDWDSSYDVYMVKMNNVQLDTDTKNIQYRFTASDTPQTTSNYDYASKNLRANTSFANESNTNLTFLYINSSTGTGTATGETTQAILYLFNFNNSSEYSFVTKEELARDYNGALRGGQGGGVYTVAEAHNGIHFFTNAGNIASGTFTLYGLKK